MASTFCRVMSPDRLELPHGRLRSPYPSLPPRYTRATHGSVGAAAGYDATPEEDRMSLNHARTHTRVGVFRLAALSLAAFGSLPP